MSDDLERDIEGRVEQLGFELVDLERAGSSHRPILRLRIDRPGAGEGEGVSLEDCKRVSRALEESLDERGDLSSRYVLEVSSPGVDRPISKARDFERFAGREIALVGRRELRPGAKKVEGTLLGLQQSAEGERVLIRLANGEELEVPKQEIKKVHLVFKWDGGKGKSE